MDEYKINLRVDKTVPVHKISGSIKYPLELNFKSNGNTGTFDFFFGDLMFSFTNGELSENLEKDCTGPELSNISENCTCNVSKSSISIETKLISFRFQYLKESMISSTPTYQYICDYTAKKEEQVSQRASNGLFTLQIGELVIKKEDPWTGSFETECDVSTTFTTII